MVYLFVFIIATVIGIISTFKNYYDLAPGYFIGNIIFYNFIFMLGFTIISFFVSIALISEVEMIPVETIGVYELVPYEENTNIYSVHTNADDTEQFYFRYIDNTNQKKEDYHFARTTVISTDSNESVKPAVKIEKLDYKNPILRFFFFALDEKRATITVNDTSQILNY